MSELALVKVGNELIAAINRLTETTERSCNLAKEQFAKLNGITAGLARGDDGEEAEGPSEDELGIASPDAYEELAKLDLYLTTSVLGKHTIDEYDEVRKHRDRLKQALDHLVMSGYDDMHDYVNLQSEAERLKAENERLNAENERLNALLRK